MQNDHVQRFNQRARQVLALAQEEAQRFNHHYIGTEHLLLGLVREGEGIAAGVLESLNVNLAKARQQTIWVLSRSGGRTGRKATAETVTCQLDPSDLNAIDLLVAAGVRGSREEAVVWLVKTGLVSQTELLMRLARTTEHPDPPATSDTTDDPPAAPPPDDQSGPPPAAP